MHASNQQTWDLIRPLAEGAESGRLVLAGLRTRCLVVALGLISKVEISTERADETVSRGRRRPELDRASASTRVDCGQTLHSVPGLVWVVHLAQARDKARSEDGSETTNG